MADPRNIVSFEGIDEVMVTYLTDASTIIFDSTLAGGSAVATLLKAVSLSAGATVQLASDAESVVGKLWLVESDLKCLVQVGGYMTLPGGSAATLTLGTKIVGALGAASAKGFIRSAASGTAAELIKMNGRIIDNTDTTNVVVQY